MISTTTYADFYSKGVYSMILTMNEQNLRLSILDFVHVYKHSNPTESLNNTTEVVGLADQLGYTPY